MRRGPRIDVGLVRWWMANLDEDVDGARGDQVQYSRKNCCQECLE